MMFASRSALLSNGRAIKFGVDYDAEPLSYADVIDRLRRQPDFNAFFLELLSSAPFSAFRWETPPVTNATADRPFEFVLLDSPEIALTPNPMDFAEHFDNADPGGVVEFPNLGGDAVLVVPCPDNPDADYGHLAAFLRSAPESQKQCLWESVGAAMQRRIGSKPVWLSTAGGGVAWLHVRLDDRPKYYAYAPYRNAA